MGDIVINDDDQEKFQEIAIVQILDFSFDYDPLFIDKRIPLQLYPHHLNKFRTQYYETNRILNFLKIPIIHPYNRLLIIWQILMAFIIGFFYFYIPLIVKYFIIIIFKITFTD